MNALARNRLRVILGRWADLDAGDFERANRWSAVRAYRDGYSCFAKRVRTGLPEILRRVTDVSAKGYYDTWGDAYAATLLDDLLCWALYRDVWDGLDGPSRLEGHILRQPEIGDRETASLIANEVFEEAEHKYFVLRVARRIPQPRRADDPTGYDRAKRLRRRVRECIDSGDQHALLARLPSSPPPHDDVAFLDRGSPFEVQNVGAWLRWRVPYRVKCHVKRRTSTLVSRLPAPPQSRNTDSRAHRLAAFAVAWTLIDLQVQRRGSDYSSRLKRLWSHLTGFRRTAAMTGPDRMELSRLRKDLRIRRAVAVGAAPWVEQWTDGRTEALWSADGLSAFPDPASLRSAQSACTLLREAIASSGGLEQQRPSIQDVLERILIRRMRADYQVPFVMVPDTTLSKMALLERGAEDVGRAALLHLLPPKGPSSPRGGGQPPGGGFDGSGPSGPSPCHPRERAAMLTFARGDGDPSPADAQCVEDVLASCTACREWLALQRELDDAGVVWDAVLQQGPSHMPRGGGSRFYAGAGGLLLAATLLLGLSQLWSTGSPAETPQPPPDLATVDAPEAPSSEQAREPSAPQKALAPGEQRGPSEQPDGGSEVELPRSVVGHQSHATAPREGPEPPTAQVEEDAVAMLDPDDGWPTDDLLPSRDGVNLARPPAPSRKSPDPSNLSPGLSWAQILPPAGQPVPAGYHMALAVDAGSPVTASVCVDGPERRFVWRGDVGSGRTVLRDKMGILVELTFAIPGTYSLHLAPNERCAQPTDTLELQVAP